MVSSNDEKAKWTRLASLGLLMAGLGPLLMLLAAVIFGLDVSEDLPFFLIVTAIALLGSFLVWRFGTWAKVVGILAGLLVGLALFWTAFGLQRPASFFDFVPGVLVIPGALVGIGASIAALVASRKGRLTSRPEGGERTWIRLLAGLIAVAVVASAALSLVARETASAQGADVRVAVKDFEFDREEYEIAAGSQVFVSNDDPFFHTFTVDELGVDEPLTARSSKVLEVPDEPGTYVLYCRPHTADPDDPSEDDMAATITVV